MRVSQKLSSVVKSEIAIDEEDNNMNLCLFIIVVGLWTIEGLRSWTHKPTRNSAPKKSVHKRHNHVSTYQYINGVAYEDIPGGWTLEA